MSAKRPSTSDDSADPPGVKKAKYQCKYQKSWKAEFSCIKRSSRGESHVMCTYCNEHNSIGHGGKNDVKRHVERPKHIENARLAGDSGVQARLTDLRWSASSSHSFQDLVTKAEVFFSQFIAEHNLPFSVGDHLTKLVKKAFPDSKIAERFQCGHTKTAAIINKALAPHYMEAIIPTARDGPITIMMDESNKRSDDKACAILVKIIDPTTFCVVNRFLDMPVCNIPTGANLFSVLEATLSKYNILWSSIKGFSSDTANVMVGKHNSVLSRVREATDNHVFDFGCVSHIANLCANSLTKALHFPVEDLLIDRHILFFSWKFKETGRVQGVSVIHRSRDGRNPQACFNTLVVS